MAGNPLLFIAGLAAAAGIGYYMHQEGYFNKIFEAINAALDKIKAPTNGNGDGGCASGKIKCKDGKCDTQSNCDKQASCKSDEDWSPSAKKCVKKANLTMAYNTPEFYTGSHRGYLITRF